MQTLLPFSDFALSARCLDNKTLRCQIRESFSLLKHKQEDNPAICMWIKERKMLKVYFNTMLAEYKSRGFKHKYDLYLIDGIVQTPYWLGDKILHLSHMVNLLRKNFDHYFQFFAVRLYVKFPSGYYWPIPKGKESENSTKAWVAFIKYHPQVFDLIEIKIPVV